MALEVKLEVFEGPLDLLLHLIDKNKIDIYDIPIVLITKQYLDYIRAMEKEDMNLCSEFLVMAATLLDIKCRMLLPAEVNEEGEEEDPRTELVQKLLEYKLYKYMSYELRDLEEGAGKSFYRKQSLPKEVASYRPPVDYEALIGDHTLTKLNEIFQFILKRQEDKIDTVRAGFGRIEKEDIDMEACGKHVQNYLRTHKKCSFKALLQKSNSKMEVIVTFMLILEMMKVGDISAKQDDLFDDITITVEKEDFDLSEMTGLSN